MADILVLETSPERIDENTIPGVRPNALVHEYLGEHLDIYRELRILREQASCNQLLYLLGSNSYILFQTNNLLRAGKTRQRTPSSGNNANMPTRPTTKQRRAFSS